MTPEQWAELARKFDTSADVHTYDNWVDLDGSYDTRILNRLLERAIREAKAEAWTEGWEEASPAFEHYAYNPYNGKIH